MAASVPPITIISPGRFTKDPRSPPSRIETTIRLSPATIPANEALSKIQPFLKIFHKTECHESTISPEFLQYLRLVTYLYNLIIFVCNGYFHGYN
uniref:Uncharacterized protein n=1 Tax=uncultured Desulfobacterales bacterium HF0200_07G10 TaxID=710741 RepID=E0XU14_9BACT|nr:hypothetical protein [uncultured Desulfobacterales bacterium HF0200_07G10]